MRTMGGREEAPPSAGPAAAFRNTGDHTAQVAAMTSGSAMDSSGAGVCPGVSVGRPLGDAAAAGQAAGRGENFSCPWTERFVR